MEEEIYTLAPKGIAILAMLDAELINDISDERFEKFWHLFQVDMLRFGYIRMEDD